MGDAMTTLIKNTSILVGGKLEERDIYLDKSSLYLASEIDLEADEVIDGKGTLAMGSLINFNFNQLVPPVNSGYSFLYNQDIKNLVSINESEYKKILLIDDINNFVNKDFDDKARYHFMNIKPENINILYELNNKNIVFTTSINFEDLVNNIEAYLNLFIENYVDFISVDKDLPYVFSYLYTNLVASNHILLDDLINILSNNFYNIYGLRVGIHNFEKGNFNLYDLNTSFRVIDKESRFNNIYLKSKLLLSVSENKIIYRSQI